MQDNLLAMLGEQLRQEFEGVITTHATDWLAPITSGAFFLPALEADTAELLQTVDAWMALVEWLTSGFFPEGLLGWETAVSPSASSSTPLPSFELRTNPATVVTPAHPAPATPLARQRRVLATPPGSVARVIAPPIPDTPTLYSNPAIGITEPTTSRMHSILPFPTEAHRPDASSATISSLESPLNETFPELGQPKRPNTFFPAPQQPHTVAGVSVNDDPVKAHTITHLVNKHPLGSAESASYPGKAPSGTSNQPTLTEKPNDKITQSQEVGENYLTANTTSLTRWSTTTGEPDGIVFGGQLNQPATRPVTGNSDKVSHSRMGAMLEQPISEPVVGNLTQSKQPVVANKPHMPMANVEWEINDDATSNLWQPEQPVVTVNYEDTPVVTPALFVPLAENVSKKQPGVKGLQDFAAFLQTAVSPSPPPNSATQLVSDQPPAPAEQPVREVTPVPKTFSSAPPQPRVVRFSLQTNPSAPSPDLLKGAQPDSLTNTAVWDDSSISGTLSSPELTQFEQITNPLWGLLDTLHPSSIQTQEEQNVFTWAEGLTQPLSVQYPVEIARLGNQSVIPPAHRQMQTAVKKPTISPLGLGDWQPIPQPMQTEEWEELIKRDETGLFKSPSSIQTDQPRENVVIPHSPPTPVKGLRELANLVQDSFADWQNITTTATANPTEPFVTSQTSSAHQETSLNPGRVEQLPKDIEQLTSSPHLTAKQTVSPEFPSSSTTSEGIIALPLTTTETTNTMPQAAISEPDIDLILEALAQEIQREYKRFYG